MELNVHVVKTPNLLPQASETPLSKGKEMR